MSYFCKEISRRVTRYMRYIRIFYFFSKQTKDFFLYYILYYYI
jgi:hypothetical protein